MCGRETPGQGTVTVKHPSELSPPVPVFTAVKQTCCRPDAAGTVVSKPCAGPRAG